MTSDETLTRARENFAGHVRAGEAALKGDNPDVNESNKHTDATDAQVAEWDRDGITGSVLLPLLADEHPAAVRCAAATYLIDRDHAAEAEPVLEALADNDDIGLIAEDADMALVQWRRKHAEK